MHANLDLETYAPVVIAHVNSCKILCLVFLHSYICNKQMQYLPMPTLPIGKRQLIIGIKSLLFPYFYGYPHILVKIMSEYEHISHFLC